MIREIKKTYFNDQETNDALDNNKVIPFPVQKGSNFDENNAIYLDPRFSDAKEAVESVTIEFPYTAEDIDALISLMYLYEKYNSKGLKTKITKFCKQLPSKTVRLRNEEWDTISIITLALGILPNVGPATNHHQDFSDEISNLINEKINGIKNMVVLKNIYDIGSVPSLKELNSKPLD